MANRPKKQHISSDSGSDNRNKDLLNTVSAKLREKTKPDIEFDSQRLAALIYAVTHKGSAFEEGSNDLTNDAKTSISDISAIVEAYMEQATATTRLNNVPAHNNAVIVGATSDHDVSRQPQQNKQSPTAITPTKTDSYRFSIAKIFRDVFDPNTEYDENNIAAIATGKGGVKSDIVTKVYLDAQGARKLTATDERIHNALDSIWGKQEGSSKQGYCTLSDLAHAAGFSNSISNRKNILESLDTMNQYKIAIDNSEEVDADYNYPSTLKSDMQGRLISYQTESVIVNGKITDKGIHFLEPMLARYSRTRRQMSAVRIEVLHYPINNSKQVIAISEYLMQYLAYKSNEFMGYNKSLKRLEAKGAKEDTLAKTEDLRKKLSKPTSITFEKLYSLVKANERKQQKRIREDAETMLKYYAGRGDFHIRNVTTGKEKFVITFSE